MLLVNFALSARAPNDHVKHRMLQDAAREDNLHTSQFSRFDYAFTAEPTMYPSVDSVTLEPSFQETVEPTTIFTLYPSTSHPTVEVTMEATGYPTLEPTTPQPSFEATGGPTFEPTTAQPNIEPILTTLQPSYPTVTPAPTLVEITGEPSLRPTRKSGITTWEIVLASIGVLVLFLLVIALGLFYPQIFSMTPYDGDQTSASSLAENGSKSYRPGQTDSASSQGAASVLSGTSSSGSSSLAESTPLLASSVNDRQNRSRTVDPETWHDVASVHSNSSI